MQIPRRFYKIAAWATGAADGPEQLAATGYLLDQTPELPDLPAATARAELAGEPPPLGPYRTYQVPIADIATVDRAPTWARWWAPTGSPLPSRVPPRRLALPPGLRPAAGGVQLRKDAADIRL